ncbi:hypothetical protein S83_062668, partial [Arachis hypogaea]
MILRDDIKFGGKAQTAFHERYQVSGQISGCMVIYTGCRGSASCKMTNARGKLNTQSRLIFRIPFHLIGINILKAHGKSARDSFLMNSFALNTGRAAQGMPLRVAPAKIACLDFNLQKTKMQLGVQVLVTDPRELEKIRQSICLEAFCDSDPSTVTSCKHEFHFQCILECLVVPFLCFGEFILLYHFYALKKVLTGRASHEVLLRIAHAALDTFNTAVVSPIYYVMFTTLTILASVIMFKLRNEVNKLEERLGVTDDHLEQK